MGKIFGNHTSKSKSKLLRIALFIFGIAAAGILAACGAAQTDSAGTTSSDALSASPAGTGIQRTDILKIANDWAEAVKSRDGRAQFALMTKALQNKVHDEFAGLNWVTGTSSPWVESYTVTAQDGGARVTFTYATSTGPAGSYSQDLTFKEEDGVLKIDAISELQEVTAAGSSASPAAPDFNALIGLIGLTKEQLLKAVPEKPVSVDEGGLGFEKTGIRVWFDTKTYTKVDQVLIMTDKIDLNGVRVGGSFDAFKSVFGEPVSDQNGDAHFKYGDKYLSVVRDTATGKTIAVYILAENF